MVDPSVIRLRERFWETNERLLKVGDGWLESALSPFELAASALLGHALYAAMRENDLLSAEWQQIRRRIEEIQTRSSKVATLRIVKWALPFACVCFDPNGSFAHNSVTY